MLRISRIGKGADLDTAIDIGQLRGDFPVRQVFGRQGNQA
jgi:hypothetical protein